MNLNDFAVMVTEKEGKKKEISIAQVREVLKVVNELTGKALYKIIRELEE